MDNILIVQLKTQLIVGCAIISAALLMTWLMTDSDREV